MDLWIRGATVWVGMAWTLGMVSVAAGAMPVVERGERILEVAYSLAEDEDFDNAFGIATEMGIDSAPLFLDWSTLEPQPGVFLPPEDPANLLAIANLFYGATGTRVSLSILPVVTLARSNPSDLEDLPFDHPLFISRFLAMLDHSLAQLTDVELNALSVGSELDLLFGADPELWRQYTAFLRAVRAHLRDSALVQANWPGLPVGVEATFDGLMSPEQRPFLETLNAEADALLVSYYPLTDNRVRPPETVHGDLEVLLTAYPELPVYFFQLGYPSGYYSPRFYDLAQLSPTLGSSDVLQARFVEEVFAAWDDYPDRIRLINFTWMHDVSQEQAEFWATSDPSFSLPNPPPAYIEFLRTLGLRTRDGAGADKRAMVTLAEATSLRGWDQRGLRPPAAPRQLAIAEVAATEVRLVWQDRSNNETGFLLEGKGAGETYRPLASFPAGSTEGRVTGLEPSHFYTFRIVATNTAGRSRPSGEAEATTKGVPGGCVVSDLQLCLSEMRFSARVVWRNQRGERGVGHGITMTDDTGHFWFFAEQNVEVVLKVLDGRPINGNFWVFYGALSNVEYWITLTDSLTGTARTYHNPLRNLASVADNQAFPGSANP